MKKRFFILAATCNALGILGAQSTAKPAKASASYYEVKSINRNKLPYHATSRRSAYIYNATHTQKLHNLRNYPRTTWYVSKSILMRSSYTGKKGFYYYVTNGAGTVSGIVWRGYLTSGTNPNATGGATPSGNDTGNSGSNNGNSSNGANNGSANGSSKNDPLYNYYNRPISNSLIDSSLNQQAIQIFPNTTPNNKIQQIANKYSLGEPENIYTDSLNHAVGDPYLGYASTETIKLNEKNFTHTTIFEISNSQRTRPLIAQLQSGSIDSKEYLNTVIPMMVEDSGGQKKVTDYAGMNIGAYMFPKDNSRYGQGVIILTAAS